MAMRHRQASLAVVVVLCCLGLAATSFVVGPVASALRKGSALGEGSAGSGWAVSPQTAREAVSVTSPIAAAAAAALVGVGVALFTGSRRAQPSRGQRVVANDGSTWGSMEYGASSSLNTSGKLPFVTLKLGADEATVYLLGACVTSYKTGGTEWLKVRPDAKFDGSKPISGGLPHCFPQFGPGDMQQHGFARNMEWRVLEEPSEAGACVLELTDNEATREMWPHAFRCEYRVELQDGQLATTLKVENTSASTFSFSAALHSYYDVFNIDTCSVTGKFEGATKLDKTQNPPKMMKGVANKLTFSKFTEEIYKQVLPGTVVLTDPTKGDLEIVNGGGWRDVIIWNPYGDKAMGAEGFICVESAELAAVPLGPKAIWEATMNLVPKPKKK